MTDKVKDEIEALVMDAYEVGRAHGAAPLYIAKGKEPPRTNEGWGPVAKKLVALVKREVNRGKGERR